MLKRSYLSSNNVEDWDLSRLGEGIVVCKNAGWRVDATHTSIQGSRIYSYGEFVLPISEAMDKRLGFSFVNGNKSVTVALLAENEKGQDRYGIQIIYFDGNNEHWLSSVDALSNEACELAQNAGVPFGVLYENGKLSVWVNGANVLHAFDLTTCDTTASAWYEDTQVVPVLTGFSAMDATIGQLHFNQTGYDGPVSPEGKWIISGADAYNLEDVEKGTVTYIANAADPNAASNLVFNILAGKNDDIYFEAVLKKGEDFNMDSVRVGFAFGGLQMSLTQSTGHPMMLQVTDWTFWDASYNLNAEQIAAFEGDGLRVGVARIDGVFHMYIQQGDGMRRVISREYSSLANAELNPAIATFGGANNAVYSNITYSVGSDVEPAKPNYRDSLVLSGSENYDVSDIENGNLVYTGSGEAFLELNAPVGVRDDFYIEVVIKKGENFNMNDLRLGFQYDNLNLNLVGGAYGMQLQITDWTFWDACYDLTAEQIIAFEDNGIRIGAGRVNGVFCMYIENNGVMEQVIAKEVPRLTSAEGNLKVATWGNAQGAVYSGLTWKIG